MKIKITKAFSYAYEGVRVVEYPEGEYEVGAGANKIGADAAKLALEEGWAAKVKAAKPAAKKKG